MYNVLETENGTVTYYGDWITEMTNREFMRNLYDTTVDYSYDEQEFFLLERWKNTDILSFVCISGRVEEYPQSSDFYVYKITSRETEAVAFSYNDWNVEFDAEKNVAIIKNRRTRQTLKVICTEGYSTYDGTVRTETVRALLNYCPYPVGYPSDLLHSFEKLRNELADNIFTFDTDGSLTSIFNQQYNKDEQLITTTISEYEEFLERK